MKPQEYSLDFFPCLDHIKIKSGQLKMFSEFFQVDEGTGGRGEKHKPDSVSLLFASVNGKELREPLRNLSMNFVLSNREKAIGTCYLFMGYKPYIGLLSTQYALWLQVTQATSNKQAIFHLCCIECNSTPYLA